MLYKFSRAHHIYGATYPHLNYLVNFQSDEYTSKVASDIAEARELIEAGYEYVTEMDGVKLFRKRK